MIRGLRQRLANHPRPDRDTASHPPESSRPGLSQHPVRNVKDSSKNEGDTGVSIEASSVTSPSSVPLMVSLPNNSSPTLSPQGVLAALQRPLILYDPRAEAALRERTAEVRDRWFAAFVAESLADVNDYLNRLRVMPEPSWISLGAEEVLKVDKPSYRLKVLWRITNVIELRSCRFTEASAVAVAALVIADLEHFCSHHAVSGALYPRAAAEATFYMMELSRHIDAIRCDKALELTIQRVFATAAASQAWALANAAEPRGDTFCLEHYLSLTDIWRTRASAAARELCEAQGVRP